MPKQQIEEFGWSSVPRNRSNIPSKEKAETKPLDVKFDEVWPKTEIVAKAQEHVKSVLPRETYNHSLRVYLYGHAMVTSHLQPWIATTPDQFFETWALTCLFHDIGTTTDNRGTTHLSFEFQGGFMALQHLQALGAPKAQAESVCEAIIRHQDPGDTGTISRMGQLIQIATEFDNMGYQPHLVHKDVIEQVVRRHPRLKWSSCFAQSIEAEVHAKPWCHTTALEGFAEAVAKNELMAPYDG